MFAPGTPFLPYLHTHSGLVPLHGYPSFEELRRSKEQYDGTALLCGRSKWGKNWGKSTLHPDRFSHLR
jgi:hypothetical protein